MWHCTKNIYMKSYLRKSILLPLLARSNRNVRVADVSGVMCANRRSFLSIPERARQNVTVKKYYSLTRNILLYLSKGTVRTSEREVLRNNFTKRFYKYLEVNIFFLWISYVAEYGSITRRFPVRHRFELLGSTSELIWAPWRFLILVRPQFLLSGHGAIYGTLTGKLLGNGKTSKRSYLMTPQSRRQYSPSYCVTKSTRTDT